jgi:hypothetical protein
MSNYIRKISDNKRRKGHAEWVVVVDGKHTTVHGTREDAEKILPKSDRKEEITVDETAQTVSNSAPTTNAPTGTVKQQIRETLFDAHGLFLSPAQVAARISRPEPSTRRTLAQLAKEGTLIKNGAGSYSIL